MARKMLNLDDEEKAPISSLRNINLEATNNFLMDN